MKPLSKQRKALRDILLIAGVVYSSLYLYSLPLKVSLGSLLGVLLMSMSTFLWHLISTWIAGSLPPLSKRAETYPPRHPSVEDRELPWLVVICREGTTEMTVFTEEVDARAFFEAAKLQWSDSFLARAVVAPRDWQGTP